MGEQEVGRPPQAGPGHSAEPEPVPVSAQSVSVPDAGHTPGPWEACEPGDYGDFDGNSRVVCSVGDMPLRIAVVHWHDSPDWREENDANARLIAAAPEMDALLRDAIDCLSWIQGQAEGAMSVTAGCATTHGDPGGGLEWANSYASDIAINAQMFFERIGAFLAAQGTPTRRAETTGSVPEGDGGPVSEGHAPNG